MLLLSISHFRLPVWFLLTSLSYTRGWSLNEVKLFVSITFSFVSGGSTVIYDRDSLLSELRERQERCLCFEIVQEQSLGLTVLHRQIQNSVLQNQKSSILMNYQTSTQACGQHSQTVCLGHHCSSDGMFTLGPWAGCTGRTCQGARGWCWPGHTVLFHIHRHLQRFWGTHALKCNVNFCKHPCKITLFT